MISFFYSSGKDLKEVRDAQAHVVFCEQDFDFASHEAARLTEICPEFKGLVEQQKFTGKVGSSCTATGSFDGNPVYCIALGIGKLSEDKADIVEHYRRALGKVIRMAECKKLSKLALHIPDAAKLLCSKEDLFYEAACTTRIATYSFDQFKSGDDKLSDKEYTIYLVGKAKDEAGVQKAIERGDRIGLSVNKSRYWSDLPADTLTPKLFAEHAQGIAQEQGLGIKVFGEKDIKQMGMGGLSGVSQGSERPAQLVIMEYATDVPNAPTVALVGKGVTFDSGGISIKPSPGMHEMKDDMAGAASVIATMEALGHVKPHVNVIGVAPLTENMPGGGALKPGDIIRFYNDKTAEIQNTDAEGRLILADALSYVTKNYELDAVFDIATLTGACAYALGPIFAAMMSKKSDLVERVKQAGERSGDRMWQLPFHEDYRVAIKSDVADICNIGSRTYKAGTITAGFFLSNFVGDTPWLHIDIAGTSFNVPGKSYYRSGATGFGVRLFVDLIQNW